MKRILVTLTVVLALVLAIAPTAFAATDCEKRICELAQADERVKQAECLVYERTVVIAIKTEKFSTKSDYDSYVQQLVNSVKTECEVDHVFVTRNPKIMKQIAELSKLDEDQRDEEIQKILDNVMKMHPIYKIDPRKLTIGQ